MTILIIDDEKMILTLAQKILARAGHETQAVTSGEEGLGLLGRESDAISLVIVDYSLDGLSGLDLMSAVREIAPDMPLVISSGQKIDRNNIPPELMKNTGVLQKPYRASELIDAVEAAVAASAPSANG
jgi:DNA-binding NtrC family response regulator